MSSSLRVVEVREVHERGDEVGIDHQRLAVGGGRLLHLPLITIVEPRSFDEVLRRERGLRIGERHRSRAGRNRARASWRSGSACALRG